MTENKSNVISSVHTPTRRLGLSRKSSPLMKQLPAPSPASLQKALTLLCENEISSPQKFRSPMLRCNNTPNRPKCNLLFRKSPNIQKPGPSSVTDNDIAVKEKTLVELQSKLAALSDNTELENDVELWKAGCKEALLSLQSWLAANEDMRQTCQCLSQRLGIVNVIQEHFLTDSEIMTT